MLLEWVVWSSSVICKWIPFSFSTILEWVVWSSSVICKFVLYWLACFEKFGGYFFHFLVKICKLFFYITFELFNLICLISHVFILSGHVLFYLFKFLFSLAIDIIDQLYHLFSPFHIALLIQAISVLIVILSVI